MVPHVAPRIKRISDAKNFRSSPQKEFCNNIGTRPTWPVWSVMSGQGDKAEVAFRDPEAALWTQRGRASVPCRQIVSNVASFRSGREHAKQDQCHCCRRPSAWWRVGHGGSPCYATERAGDTMGDRRRRACDGLIIAGHEILSNRK